LLIVDNTSSHFHDQSNTCELNEPIESNFDLDEETSNNSEPEITAVLCRNPNQGTITSYSNHNNRDKHDKHSTGGIPCEEIEVATNVLLEQQEEDVNELDSEIIKIVLDEANQRDNKDPDDSDKEQLEIPISEELIGLNKFIGFFEQQIDEEFKAKDLKIF
ncbi:10003_t:CDS:2, partial [Racocetra fulgida]